MSAFFFDYCTYPDIIPHKRLYIHNPAICHSLCLSHEHSSYDVGLDNGIDNADDIDHQPNGFVYQYEKNGNLQRDNQEHIQLEWTMAGKVKKVINTLTNNAKAEFLYDAMGNRVRKTVYASAGTVERNIFYTYAPDGKLLQMTEQSNEGLLMSMEYPLYGISRLGLYKVTSSLSREDESGNRVLDKGEYIVAITIPPYFDKKPNKSLLESQSVFGVSIDGKIHVLINPALVNQQNWTGLSMPSVSAHELYSHTDFFMLRHYYYVNEKSEVAKSIYPWHLWNKDESIDYNKKLKEAYLNAEKNADK